MLTVSSVDNSLKLRNIIIFVILFISLFILYNSNYINTICRKNNEVDLLNNLNNQIILLSKELRDYRKINFDLNINIIKQNMISKQKLIRYQNTDLPHFNVTYIKRNEFESNFLPSLNVTLNNHKLSYLDYPHQKPEVTKAYLDLYEKYLDYNLDREVLESQYYVRYCNTRQGHGVFANKDLKPGMLLDEYLGIVF